MANPALRFAACALLLTLPGCASHPVSTSAAAVTHQRLLPLEGGQNFRDLGGYAAAGGKTVRWGMIYRSGSMHGLTAHDFAILEGLGLRTVTDFRSSEERRAEPVNWPGPHAPNVFSTDYALNIAPMMRAFAKPGLTADEARAAMAGLYRDIPFMLSAQYRRMFAELAAGDAPLAFNCSAGKDRTGVAAALVLTALGVDREAVIGDYLLSNQYYRPINTALVATPSGQAAMPTMAPAVLQAMRGVDRSYLEAAFAAIEARPGGMRAYLRDDMGLTPRAIAALRARYLR